MKKHIKTILAILLAAILAVASFDILLLKSYYYNPYDLHVRCQVIEDAALPASMDGVSALWISDLEYSPEYGEERLEKLFEQAAQLQPDFVFFTGDLFSAQTTVSPQMKELMTQLICSIPAPLGKFAVYGEQDLIDGQRLSDVHEIYFLSGVEVLDNQSVQAGNNSTDTIRIAGISISGDFSAAFADGRADQFTLLLSHWPDNAAALSDANAPISLALCSNAHGTQIQWPLLGGYRKWEGSTRINRSSLKKLNFPYEISSGIGCIEVSARLNSPSELVYLTFRNKNASQTLSPSLFDQSQNQTQDEQTSAPEQNTEQTRPDTENSAGQNPDASNGEDPAQTDAAADEQSTWTPEDASEENMDAGAQTEQEVPADALTDNPDAAAQP